jgi:hypothetical protein
MKGRIYILLYFALGFSFSCDTDSNIESPDGTHFVKYYGADEDEQGVDLLLLQDGTSILLGRALTGERRIYLVKIDPAGNILWEKYMGTSSDVAKDIEPTLDGNFVILSNCQNPADNIDAKIIKVDSEGEKIDSVVHGSSGIENAQSITPLSDGGFIIAGSTEFSSTDQQIFHFRCDQNLDFNIPLWEDYYGGDLSEPIVISQGTKVFEKSPTEFYVFGYSNMKHAGKDPAATEAKINLLYYLLGSGGVVNAKPNFLGDADLNTTSSAAIHVQPGIGGGYFVLGTRYNAGSMSLHASKLRPSLAFTSVDELLDVQVSVGSTQTFEAVSAAGSQFGGAVGFLLLANEYRLNNHINISLSKIDQSGNVQWYVSLGSEDKDDRAAAVAELPDGRIFVLGTVVLGDQSKMALFKLNSAGQLIK